MTWEYIQPVRIIFGNGTLARLNDETNRLGGKRGMLITSRSFEKRGMVEQIMQNSEGRIACYYSEVSANPTVEECDACARLLRDNLCDFVVALGGGSVMDCAKAAATFCTSDKKATEYLGTGLAIPTSHLPLIALPTTAGTGSEVTSVSVLSDHERGIKAPLSADGFYPTLAIVDPELTLTLPPHTTACTGFDVMCHAIEGYWSRNHQPVCDTLAIKALRMAIDNLEKAFNHPDDTEARERMAEASLTAGLAFNLPKTNSAHACSYPLTNWLGIAHGEACAMTITHFMRYNAEHGDPRTETLARLVGFNDAHALADHLDGMRQRTGMMMNLTQFHLDTQQSEKLANAFKHPNLKNNPVEVSDDFLRELVDKLRSEE